MRLWSIHPKYLDQKGLGALWREALLAKAVLEGKTKGYRNHTQLIRFKACADPLAAINGYLVGVWAEAQGRGYKFDDSKIGQTFPGVLRHVPVTIGQMGYEAEWLIKKIEARTGQTVLFPATPLPHPLFHIVPGPVESWEKVK